MSTMKSRQDPASLPSPLGGEEGRKGEEAWIEVIHKMDEVYSDLLKYEVALEEKNAALEESQQFVLSVLSSMSDLLLVCDLEGRIEVVNQALINFTGKPETELVGTSLFDLFPDGANRTAARQSFATQGLKGLADCELELLGADGMPVAVSFNCMPRHHHRGALLGMVVTGRPLGELRRAYQALHEAHEDLKRTQQQLLHSDKMASLGRLVAGVAHELNNPISFVLGNVHALRRYAARLDQYIRLLQGEHSPEALARLRDELRIDYILEDLPSLMDGTIEGAERTRDIVDSLKRFSVVDRDQARPFNLAEIIERSVNWVRKASPDRFQVDLDLPEGITVVGSSGQIQQVVMNLVQNACDATAEMTEPRLAITARQIGNQVEVRFHDNGPGIPASHLAHIFEPFFTTKPVGKGTGLGLAISYGLVEQHGGRLEAANAPEGGALFTLSLPLGKP